MLQLAREADRVFTESTQKGSVLSQFESAKLMTTPYRQITRKALPAADMPRLEAVIQRFGLEKMRLPDIRPQFAGFLIFNAYNAETRRYSPAAGYSGFLRVAVPPERIEGLEDLLAATRAYATSSASAELRWLITLLNEPALEERANYLDALTTAWRKGDMNRLGLLYRTAGDVDDVNALGVRDEVIVQRSRRWVEKLETALRRSNHLFVAVGLAHAIGPDSLVAQLEARGFVSEFEPVH